MYRSLYIWYFFSPLLVDSFTRLRLHGSHIDFSHSAGKKKSDWTQLTDEMLLKFIKSTTFFFSFFSMRPLVGLSNGKRRKRGVMNGIASLEELNTISIRYLYHLLLYLNGWWLLARVGATTWCHCVYFICTFTAENQGIIRNTCWFQHKFKSWSRRERRRKLMTCEKTE